MQNFSIIGGSGLMGSDTCGRLFSSTNKLKIIEKCRKHIITAHFRSVTNISLRIKCVSILISTEFWYSNWIAFQPIRLYRFTEAE